MHARKILLRKIDITQIVIKGSPDTLFLSLQNWHHQHKLTWPYGALRVSHCGVVVQVRPVRAGQMLLQSIVLEHMRP